MFKTAKQAVKYGETANIEQLIEIKKQMIIYKAQYSRLQRCAIPQSIEDRLKKMAVISAKTRLCREVLNAAGLCF